MGYWQSLISNNTRLLVAGEGVNRASPLYKFYLELTESFRLFREAGDYSRQAYRNWDIAKIAMKRGYNVVMTRGSEYISDVEKIPFACVMPPQLDRNNPIIANFRRHESRQNRDLEMFSKFVRDNQLQGTVSEDLTLGEDFTKIPFTLSISPAMFRVLDDYELAAGMLHELGHVYFYFRYLMRSLMANGVADHIATKFMETEDREIRIKLLTSAQALTGSKFSDIENLVKENRRENIYVHVVSDVMMVRDEIPGGGGVVNRNWERLADYYVGRHGASDKLATGLYKLDTSVGWLMQNRAYDTFGAHYVVEASRLLILVAANATTSPLGFAIGMGLLTGIGTLLFGDTTENMYDTPEQRYLAMRRCLVEQLNDMKSADPSPETNAALKRNLEGIATIDKLLESVKDKDSLFTFIHKKLFPSGRQNDEVSLYNADLEAFALNDLIVQAAKFKGVSQ